MVREVSNCLPVALVTRSVHWRAVCLATTCGSLGLPPQLTKVRRRVLEFALFATVRREGPNVAFSTDGPVCQMQTPCPYELREAWIFADRAAGRSGLSVRAEIPPLASLLTGADAHFHRPLTIDCCRGHRPSIVPGRPPQSPGASLRPRRNPGRDPPGVRG